MGAEVTGTVHGETIRLDEPVPALDGRHVRVLLEPIEDTQEPPLSAADQVRLLQEWAARGPQGPLEVDSAWPDES